MEIESSTTKLNAGDKGKKIRRTTLILGIVYVIPHLIYLILTGPGIVDRYGPAFYFYAIWPLLFYTATGILCVVVCVKFMKLLAEKEKIKQTSRSKVTRVTHFIKYLDCIKSLVDHQSVACSRNRLYGCLWNYNSQNLCWSCSPQ
jgi:hypothetical protein